MQIWGQNLAHWAFRGGPFPVGFAKAAAKLLLERTILCSTLKAKQP